MSTELPATTQSRVEIVAVPDLTLEYNAEYAHSLLTTTRAVSRRMTRVTGEVCDRMNDTEMWG